MDNSVVIGTVEQYPGDEALAAINGLRVSINEACNHQDSGKHIVVCADLFLRQNGMVIYSHNSYESLAVVLEVTPH